MNSKPPFTRFTQVLCGLTALIALSPGRLCAQGGGPPGGRVSVLVADPSNPSVLYAGGGRGLFKSTNGGAGWSPVNSGLPDTGVLLALAIDPSNTSTLYAGLHEGGVFKSTNGGARWNAIDSSIYANSLVIDPSNPSTLYAGGYTRPFNQVGLFKSTDGGASWIATRAGLPPSTSVTVLTMDPSNTSTLYAGLSELGVFKSSNGGATWTRVSSGLGGLSVSALAIDHSNPLTLYAGMTLGSMAGLFKSTNGGASWTAVRGILPTLALAIDPSNTSTLYAGTFGGIFKSTNRGDSWMALNFARSQAVVRVLAMDPSNSSTLYAGTFGSGVFKSTNTGASWTAASSGLTNTTTASPVIDPTNPSVLYTATSGDDGWVFKSTNGGASWMPASPDSRVSTLAIDPSNPSTLYAGTFGSGVFKSTDGGAAWTAGAGGLPQNFNVQALIVDPSNPSTLYAGGGGLFKSTNGGASWTAASSGIPPSVLARGVTVLAIDPSDASTLYAGTGGGQVGAGLFKSTNGAGNWTSANPTTGELAGTTSVNITALVIDPSDPSTVYAGGEVAGRLGALDGVFKLTNGGTLWTVARSGIPNGVLVTALGLDPSTPSTLYAGTRGGVFKSTDGGAFWVVASSGVTNPNVSSLAMDPSDPFTLYAGTQGSGVFKSTDGASTWQPTGSSYGNGAGPASKIAKVSGDNQAGTPGRPLRGPLVVVVTNSSGIPLAGVTVGFTVTAGAGRLSAGSVLTDDQGVASTVLTLGPDPATTVTATAAGLSGSPITFNAGGGGTIPQPANALNAASFASPGTLTPGGIFSVFGNLLTDGTTAEASGIPLPNRLAEATVLVNGIFAPLFYAAPRQINAQLPVKTPSGSAQLVVSVGGRKSSTVMFAVENAAPGIFTYNSTRAVAVNPDGSVNGPASPARPGDTMVVYLTGAGPVQASGAWLEGAPSPPGLSPVTLPFTATLGGQDAATDYLGLTPGSIGLYQLNMKVPSLPRGDHALILTVGGKASNSALVSVSP